MKATQYLTDKDHTLLETEVFPALYMPAATVFAPREAPVAADFKGFGVAITGSSCYQLSLMAPDERTAFLQSIYGRDGLNLSVARISVASSDYSAELYSYDDVPFDTELTHFSVERDERYVIPMIKEVLKIRPDLLIFSSPWSPPGWMKTEGTMCGGYMRDEFVECYVEYYIKFLKAYEAHGIHISALTPQNEPETDQNSQMPACVWHPEIAARFIILLKKRLLEEGMDTKIWMYDHNFNWADRVRWMLDEKAGLKDAADGVAFHYYGGVIEDTLQIRAAYPQLTLHFTEAGPRLYDHYDSDFCKWGIMIARALSCGYSSFTGWNLLLNELGGPNIGPFFCGGLVTRNTADGALSYSGQYKAFRHIAPFVNEKTEFFALDVKERYTAQPMFSYPHEKKKPYGVLGVNADGSRVLLLVNQDDEKRQSQIQLDGQWYYIEQLPESISTVVFKD